MAALGAIDPEPLEALPPLPWGPDPAAGALAALVQDAEFKARLGATLAQGAAERRALRARIDDLGEVVEGRAVGPWHPALALVEGLPAVGLDRAPLSPSGVAAAARH